MALNSSLRRDSIIAYHATRAFMTANMPAIARMTAAPTRLLCRARETTANCAAMR
jgi:hypothetical protein